MLTRLVSLLLIAAFIACSDPQQPAPDNNYTSTQIGEVTDTDVSEISGMVRSRSNADILWVINDSGDGPYIYALAKTGELLDRFKIKDADNEDWEDMAAFSSAGTNYLLIADTGGNTSNREKFDLYIVAEPDLQNAAEKIEWQWRIRFEYEDEPRDCEAVAVDEQAEKIYLLSKRSVPAVLYELPLRSDQKTVTAKRLGEITTIPQPTEDEIQEPYDEYHAQPTGMAINPDGDRLVILTYRRLFLFERNNDQSWLEAINQSPLQIEYPTLEQAEAVCFIGNGPEVLITSEQIPAPILKIEPN